MKAGGDFIRAVGIADRDQLRAMPQHFQPLQVLAFQMGESEGAPCGAR